VPRPEVKAAAEQEATYRKLNKPSIDLDGRSLSGCHIGKNFNESK
jgi:hypothetical protein